MKLGSLFDGIGGFPLAATMNNITPIWASEIEAVPIAITKKHFPNMKHLGDITNINGAEIEPVDIISFGSPCQDLSVAGKGKGLAGERSGLFMEAVRIIREMREATNAEYPRYALWENVPGAFSSNKGRDFRAVLSALAESEIPMPRSGQWADAGMVRGNGREIAWRCLDAQYWGVPQRRKRIFLIVDFRGQCAGEILFECQSVSGDTQESGSQGEEAAGSVGNGVEATSRVFYESGPGFFTEGVGCLRAEGENRPSRPAHQIVEPICFEPRGQDGVPRIHGDISPTLNTMRGGQRQPCVAIQHSIIGRKDSAGAQGPGLRDDGKMFTLDSRGSAHAVAIPEKDSCVTTGTGRRYDFETETIIPVPFPEVANTLLAKPNFSYRADVDNMVRIGYRVRRLTPKECERLQGFPDDWTAYGEEKKDGLFLLKPVSDSARYKACGNSIAIPPVEWIMSQIKKYGGM